MALIINENNHLKKEIEYISNNMEVIKTKDQMFLEGEQKANEGKITELLNENDKLNQVVIELQKDNETLFSYLSVYEGKNTPNVEYLSILC